MTTNESITQKFAFQLKIKFLIGKIQTYERKFGVKNNFYNFKSAQSV